MSAYRQVSGNHPLDANCKLCRASYQVVFVAQGSLIAYYLDFCLIGTSSIFIHFQDWLIGSHLRFYRKRYCGREATICILCTHRMCSWQRSRTDKSSYLEKLCPMLIMESQPREVRGDSYQSRSITVRGLYIYIGWCRCCLNNYRY